MRDKKGLVFNEIKKGLPWARVQGADSGVVYGRNRMQRASPVDPTEFERLVASLRQTLAKSLEIERMKIQRKLISRRPSRFFLLQTFL